MQNASQSVALALPTTTPYNFPSLTERAGDFAVKYMSSLLYNTFSSTGDSARMAIYFSTISGTSSGATFSFNNYGGMPLVFDAISAQSSSSSNFNSGFTSGSNKNLFKARVITYAKQEFILAEAALNSSAANALKQIVTQKWIANINNGFEGWIEYKITGYPNLDPEAGSVNLNGGKIALRFLYPTTEKSINSTNHNAELKTMGGQESTGIL